MSARGVIYGLGLTVAAILAANEFVQHMVRNSVPRQAIRTIVAAPATIDVLGIGNSLIAADFDAATLEKVFQDSQQRPCVALNGGLGASGVIEHLALTRLALSHHQVKTLVYGFFDQQMSSDIPQRNAELLGNRSMLYYLEPELTLQYARFNPVEWLSFNAYRSLALLRERSAIWAKVEMLRRDMASLGMPPEETNQFGRRADFAQLEAADSQAFSRACRKILQSGELISPPVQALFRLASEHGVKVIVVEMPMHPIHLKKFYAEPIWTTFRSETRQAVERAGAAYWDASASVSDGRFFDDALHLSPQGAAHFSQLLAGYLLENR